MKEKRNDNAFFKRDFFPNWSKNVARAPPKKAGAATFLLIAFPLFFFSFLPFPRYLWVSGVLSCTPLEVGGSAPPSGGHYGSGFHS